MPNPSNGRVDPLLSTISQAITNEGKWLAPQILPLVGGLKEKSGLIGSIGTENLRQYNIERSVYDLSAHRMDFTVSKDDTYRIKDYDIGVYLPDALVEQFQLPFDARKIATRYVSEAMMLQKEIALATAMTNTAVITQNTTLSGTSQWDDYNNSNPQDDIETGRDAVFSGTGLDPNFCVISRNLFNVLKRHPFFLEQVKGITALTPEKLQELMMRLFEIEHVFVAKSLKVTSKTGQTVTKGAVWGNDFVMGYRPETASLMTPSFGYTFKMAGKNEQIKIRRELTEDKGDIVEILDSFDQKILNTGAAYLIKSAI
jgi:hypothetical protein